METRNPLKELNKFLKDNVFPEISYYLNKEQKKKLRKFPQDQENIPQTVLQTSNKCKIFNILWKFE